MGLLSKIKQLLGQQESEKKKPQNTETTNTVTIQTVEPMPSAEEQSVRRAIDSITFQNLENNELFIGVIPVLHKYPFALEFISKNSALVDFYTSAIFAKKQRTIPFDVEEAIIKSKYTILLYAFQSKGHKWSSNAAILMQKHHPTAYYHFFKLI